MHLADGGLARYAAEVAEHKRDPYTLVEEIARGEGKVKQIPRRLSFAEQISDGSE